MINRPGNRPSHEGAAREVDRALTLFATAGFRKILLRGDTDFSQTQHLDGWNANACVRFIFGYDCKANLQEIADELPDSAWQPLSRPVGNPPKTGPRKRPENIKDKIVRQREYETLRLRSEDIAEFEYQPAACERKYRMIVIRKNITRSKGELALFDEVRYFFSSRMSESGQPNR